MAQDGQERSALFLDRDGTLIVDVGYPRDPERVELLPGAAEALRDLAGQGFALVIVSNQSGVARGRITPDEAERVQARVVERFAAAGVTFDGAYFCFHGPDDGCPCRKPSPGMLRRASEDLGLSLASSVMVGDKPSDVQAGHAAGCSTVHFGDPAAPCEPPPTMRSRSWPEVAAFLRSTTRKTATTTPPTRTRTEHR